MMNVVGHGEWKGKTFTKTPSLTALNRAPTSFDKHAFYYFALTHLTTIITLCYGTMHSTLPAQGP